MLTRLQQTESSQNDVIYFCPYLLEISFSIQVLLLSHFVHVFLHFEYLFWKRRSSRFSLLITLVFLFTLSLVTVISAFSSVLKCRCSKLILHFLPLLNHQFLHGHNEMEIIFNADKCVIHRLCFFLSLMHDALLVFLDMWEIYRSLI